MVRGKRIPREGEWRDDATANEVFLDDSFEHLRHTGVIPYRFGIHYRDRTLDADSEAVCFRSINQRFRANQIELLKSPL